MLVKGELDVPYRILSVDPGTDTIGFAIVDLDLATFEITITYARTLATNKRRLINPLYEQAHGTSYAKRTLIQKHASYLLHRFEPHAMAVESPFLGRLPQAFEALIEVRTFLRRALVKYDVGMSMELYSPTHVKNAVGVSGKSKDKNDMTEALRKLDVTWGEGVSLEALDEHSVDAIAVGYRKAKLIIEELTE